MSNLSNQKNHTGRLLGLATAMLTCLFAVTTYPGTQSYSLPKPAEPAPVAAPSWTSTGDLNTKRYGHTATLLPNGKVLVAGGGGLSCSGYYCLPAGGNSSAELYDPATGTWGYTGSLKRGRVLHTATLLKNGQVLVAGGAGDIYGDVPLNSAELYDPATGSWRPTGSFSTILQSYSPTTLLPNGKVLAIGISDTKKSIVDSAELYDPATGTWNITSSPNNVAEPGGASTILLPNGKTLALFGNFSLRDPASAELYDPATESWSSIDHLNILTFAGTVTLLRNGKVLVTGGAGSSPVAELYDPNTAKWSITGNPNTFRRAATLLSDGRVLMSGGYDSYLPATGEELYDPATGTWGYTSRLIAARDYHTATLLQNGRVLVAGGCDDFYGNPVFYSSAELYTPATPIPNQIDDAQFFVRQHYRDFLNREPDPDGLAFWTNEIISCGGDAQCVDAKRINVSAAYFLSIEFQQTGYLVYRFYKASYGNAPGTPVPLRLNEFLPDTKEIGQGVVVNQSGWEQVLKNNKQAFATEFVQRSRFVAAYPTSMSADQFVDALFANAGVTPSSTDRTAAINEFGSAMTSADVAARARALRRVAENSTLVQQEFNRALVLMQYFGYLRRNPNDLPEPTLDFQGYNFWVNKLTQFNGDFSGAEMVKAFITSGEYRQRFGP